MAKVQQGLPAEGVANEVRILNMVARIPAPVLCQRDDEDVIREMGAIIFPGFVQRIAGAKSLQLELLGDYRDSSLLQVAANQFQVLLGALRAWRPLAGQRVDEIRPGIGPGSIQDEHGNQLVMPGSAISHNRFGSEVESYARDVRSSLSHSLPLSNALWLNGRRDRNAADFYMIYEYAEADLGGPKAIVAAIGVTNNDLKRLKSSANNLNPLAGGRHAKGAGTAEWSLNDQADFISRFLRKWISWCACNVV